MTTKSQNSQVQADDEKLIRDRYMWEIHTLQKIYSIVILYIHIEALRIANLNNKQKNLREDLIVPVIIAI